MKESLSMHYNSGSDQSRFTLIEQTPLFTNNRGLVPTSYVYNTLQGITLTWSVYSIYTKTATLSICVCVSLYLSVSLRLSLSLSFLSLSVSLSLCLCLSISIYVTPCFSRSAFPSSHHTISRATYVADTRTNYLAASRQTTLDRLMCLRYRRSELSMCKVTLLPDDVLSHPPACPSNKGNPPTLRARLKERKELFFLF